MFDIGYSIAVMRRFGGVWSANPMSEQEFLAALTGNDSDLRLAVNALRCAGQRFCLIGGLAVNHYVEPVVTLDADFAVAASADRACAPLSGKRQRDVNFSP